MLADPQCQVKSTVRAVQAGGEEGTEAEERHGLLPPLVVTGCDVSCHEPEGEAEVVKGFEHEGFAVTVHGVLSGRQGTGEQGKGRAKRKVLSLRGRRECDRAKCM